jgi:hypothetical protein
VPVPQGNADLTAPGPPHNEGEEERNRIPIADLLAKSQVMSMNQIAVDRCAIEAWKCNNSTDGGWGRRNAIGRFLHNVVESNTRQNGQFHEPAPSKSEYFLLYGRRALNRLLLLRTSKNINEARRAGQALARASPI